MVRKLWQVSAHTWITLDSNFLRAFTLIVEFVPCVTYGTSGRDTYHIALNSSRAIINYEGNFARKNLVNFWEHKYFWESNWSNQSVIEMMRYFHMKGYPRERGIKFIHYFGGYYSRKYGLYTHIWSEICPRNFQTTLG